MEPITIFTLDKLITRLQELSKDGYGDYKVTANMEYNVFDVSVDEKHNVIDFDCFY